MIQSFILRKDKSEP